MIVIIVVVYMAVTGKFNSSNNNNNNGNTNAKRSAVGFDGETPVTSRALSKIVAVGRGYDAAAAPLEKFSGVTSAKSLAGRIAMPDNWRAGRVDRRSDMTLPVQLSIDYKRAAYNEVD